MGNLSNTMTAREFLHRVLRSGEVTKIGQHLALVVYGLCQLEGSEKIETSVRDLEQITGWRKSAIADHLAELQTFIRTTWPGGRAKTTLELQGLIEGALKDIFVSAPADTTADTRLVSVEADTTADTTADTNLASAPTDTTADTKPVVSVPADTKPILVDLREALASAMRTQAEIAKEKSPHTPLKEKTTTSLSESGVAGASESARARVDASPDIGKPITATPGGKPESPQLIEGPGFKIDLVAIDMIATLIGMPSERARLLAQICARDWVANGMVPDNAMAMVKAAIKSDLHQSQIQEVRLGKAHEAASAARPRFGQQQASGGLRVPLERPKPFWWRTSKNVGALSEKSWREFIQAWANGTWPIDVLGPVPGTEGCLIPDGLVAELRLTEVYTDMGVKRA